MRDPITALLRLVVPPRLRPHLKALYYRGNRYMCPICGSRLRTFLPGGVNLPVLKEQDVVGGVYRLNIRCPVCGSLDRMGLLYLYFSRKTDLFIRRERILHFAPEMEVEGRLRHVSGADYVTADLYDLYGDHVMIKVDITDIQFSDNTFDVIICNHVLEHVQKRQEGDAGAVPHLEEAGFEVDLFQWTTESQDFETLDNRFGLNEKEAVYRVIKYADKPARSAPNPVVVAVSS